MPEAVNLHFGRALKRALGLTYRHAMQNPLRASGLTVLVVAAIGLVFVCDLGAVFAYQRSRVALGEWWRIVTPLMVHSSRDHLAWNLITMAASGVVAEGIDRKRYALTLLVSALVIGLAVHFAMPSVHRVVGASGTAAAVFTFILVRLSVLNWRVDPWVAIVACGILAAWGAYEAGLWGRLTPWEVFTGRSVRGDPGHRLIPFHLIGMLSALPIALWPGKPTTQNDAQTPASA